MVSTLGVRHDLFLFFSWAGANPHCQSTSARRDVTTRQNKLLPICSGQKEGHTWPRDTLDQSGVSLTQVNTTILIFSTHTRLHGPLWRPSTCPRAFLASSPRHPQRHPVHPATNPHRQTQACAHDCEKRATRMTHDPSLMHPKTCDAEDRSYRSRTSLRTNGSSKAELRRQPKLPPLRVLPNEMYVVLRYL
eukprot:5284690-Prymnesium_polylepis.2